jgi:2-keto-4-pentenoate hydratase
MSTESLTQTAARIAAEILDHAPFEGHAEAVGTTFNAAYAMQDLVVAELTGPGPRGPVAGYKLAANSAKAMAAMGLSEPLTARIFADQCRQSPADLRAERFLTRAFESEIAALIARDVPPGTYDRDSIAGYIARLVPAFEVLDMRQARPAPDMMPLAVAQNISTEGAVLGGPGVVPEDLDPEHLHVRVSLDGAELSEVKGAAPQHPLDAVVWLAGHLTARGLPLSEGMVVLCGTHTPILMPGGEGRLVLEMAGLGEAVAEIG